MGNYKWYQNDVIFGDMMAERQITFRLEDNLLQKLDIYIKKTGFRTRNEWFRNKVITETESREEFLQRMKRIADEKGITREIIANSVMDVRKELYREKYGKD